MTSSVATKRPADSSTTLQPISDHMLVLLILSGSLLSVMHSRWIAVPLLPLAVVAVVAWDRWPWAWIIAAALSLAVALMLWHHYEDHVFFGIYQLLAVGIALTRPDFRSSIKLQLRWLTGALFGVAVVWKLASASYRNGDLFRTVALADGRFDPLTTLLGRFGADTLAANREAALDLATTTSGASIPLLEPAGFSTVALVLGVWTILIEVAIAVSFLAPDDSRPARLRHPSLLTFGLTTYALVPVVGFSIMLAAAGLSDDRARPLTQWLYLLILASALVRGVIVL